MTHVTITLLAVLLAPVLSRAEVCAASQATCSQDPAADNAAKTEAEVEQEEALEAQLMDVRLLQTKKEQKMEALEAHTGTAGSTQTQSTELKEEGARAGLDHNGNLCLLCGKPKEERLGGKIYKEFRTDCGSKSSPTGPSRSDLWKPAVEFLDTKKARNAFCELNFAKSCVDAVANQDYMYWAKSIDFRGAEAMKSGAFDAQYCRLNGFLEKEVVALQHNFTGMRDMASNLCATKYAKHGIEKLSFVDMLTKARFSADGAPTMEEAEVLAAWNCAMGDLGCDMAACAYSFCKAGEGKHGTYDECHGWHPVNGMPVSASV